MRQLLSFLLLFWCIIQSISAQAPSSSTVANPIWYYIECGHSSDPPAGSLINDSDGRFCTVITANGIGTTTATGVTNMPLYPNAQRTAQRWRLEVADEVQPYYYLINQVGQYLYFLGNIYQVTDNIADAGKFKLEQLTATSAYFRIKRHDQDNNMVNAANSGGDPAWRIYEASTATSGEDPNTGLPTAGAPRAWRFAPAAELDNAFPTIYPKGTPVEDVTEWFYIKSADAAIANAARYISRNGDAFELTDKNFGADGCKQLFGFISNGISSTPAQSLLTHIVSLDTKTYFAGTILGATPFDWSIRHVQAPKKTDGVQSHIRTHRLNGNILKNDFTIPSWVKTSTIYSDAYTWTYEKAYVVEVRKSPVVTITAPVTTTTTYAVEQGSSFTLSFSLISGYALTGNAVTVNGQAEMPNFSNNVYSLTIPSIEASTTVIEIATEAVQPVASTLSDLKLDGTSIDGFDPETFIYNVTLPIGATDYPVITYTADPLAIITTTAFPEILNPGGLNTATIAVTGDESKTYKIYFTVADDVIRKVIAAQSVYIERAGNSGNNHDGKTFVQIQTGVTTGTETTQYDRQGLFQFDLTGITATDVTNANKVVLRLAVGGHQASSNPIFRALVVPYIGNGGEWDQAIMTGNSSGIQSSSVFPEEQVIGGAKLDIGTTAIPFPSPITDADAANPRFFELDVTDYILNNLESKVTLLVLSRAENTKHIQVFRHNVSYDLLKPQLIFTQVTRPPIPAGRIYPKGDTYTNASTTQRSDLINYGFDATLSLKGAESDPDYHEAYIKFNINDVATTNTKFFLNLSAPSEGNSLPEGGILVDVYAFPYDQAEWNEYALSHNNKPVAVGTFVTSVEFTAENLNAFVDITSEVKTNVNGTLALILKLNPANKDNQLFLYSRENTDPNIRPHIQVSRYYQITINGEEHVTLEKSGIQEVDEGGEFTLSFNTDEDYAPVVTVNETEVTPVVNPDGSQYTYSITFTNVTEDKIIEVTATKRTGITNQVISEEIVARQYYTLLGIEVGKPISGRVYIVKTIYNSQKTDVQKVIYQK